MLGNPSEITDKPYFPAETDTEYANLEGFFVNTPAQAQSLLYNLKQAALAFVNASKRDFTYFKQGAISTN